VRFGPLKYCLPTVPIQYTLIPVLDPHCLQILSHVIFPSDQLISFMPYHMPWSSLLMLQSITSYLNYAITAIFIGLCHGTHPVLNETTNIGLFCIKKFNKVFGTVLLISDNSLELLFIKIFLFSCPGIRVAWSVCLNWYNFCRIMFRCRMDVGCAVCVVTVAL
jgi:hypothetical protein